MLLNLRQFVGMDIIRRATLQQAYCQVSLNDYMRFYNFCFVKHRGSTPLEPHRHSSAPGGRRSEVRMAQRSKSLGAPSRKSDFGNRKRKGSYFAPEAAKYAKPLFGGNHPNTITE